MTERLKYSNFIVGLVVVGIILVGIGWDGALAQGEQPPQPPMGEIVFGGQVNDITQHLPLIHRSHPPDSIFGVEMSTEIANPNVGAVPYTVSQAGATWTRYNALTWADVEPTPGARLWQTQSLVDQGMLAARKYNIKPILIIFKTPAWAQKVAGSSCGPIKQDALDEFANFMRDVVTRYSGYPYYVTHFELWNEPDVEITDWNRSFGCWGVWYDDRYYGGDYYGTMLKSVYPAMKQANPNIQVLVGGLLLGCDPRNPPPGKTDGCRSSKFLEGILANGAGDFFDGVAFHAYDYFPAATDIQKENPNSGLGNYSNSNWWSAWNTTGPVLVTKAIYLREVLNKYGYGHKYLINTEVAVICGDDVSIDDHCDSYFPTTSLSFQNTKAYFVVQSFAAARWLNLKANIWYSYFGWRDSGFYNSHANKQEVAFNAFSFTRQKINWAYAANEIKNYPDVKGYEFLRTGEKVWVLWFVGDDPKDGALIRTINLPAMPKAVYTWVKAGSGTANDGTYQPAAVSQSLYIGRAPVFIVFPP